MEPILILSKSFALQICGELADSGEDARVKAALKRYFENENEETLRAAYAALGTLSTARRKNIKAQLGGYGRGL